MNLNLLIEDLEQSDKPGLEPFDPRFTDIVALIESVSYVEAGQQCEALLKNKVYDVSVMGYHFYSHFIEEGILALKDVFTCLETVLTEKLEFYGPVRNKPKKFSASLKWLFEKLLKTLERERTKDSDNWKAWQKACSYEECEAIQEALAKVKQACNEHLEGKSKDAEAALTKVNGELNGFLNLLTKAVVPEPEEVVEEKTEEVVEAAPEQAVSNFVGGPVNMEHGSYYSKVDDGSLEYSAMSYSLNKLLLKISGFKILCDKQDFVRAKIVMEDLESELKDFTVENYFPELFSEYFNLMAENEEELLPHFEEKGSLRWNALVQLFESDPVAFVNVDL